MNGGRALEACRSDGFKQSGWGRENGRMGGVEAFTEVKSVHIGL